MLSVLLANGNMNKPINIYICLGDIKEGELDWTYLYPRPKPLFDIIKENRFLENIENNFVSCPALSNKFKKILVFENALKGTYSYDFSDGKQIFQPTSKTYLSYNVKNKSINTGPMVQFDLTYSMFSDESLDAYFTPPFFHKPEYMKYGSVIPGEFNIGKWIRPFFFQVQMWENVGTFELKEEPLFYMELKTDRPIKVHYFKASEQLFKYIYSGINLSSFFGKGRSLSERYARFENVGMRSKVLAEIKNNLIE